jgi:uncharacterized protein YnzC (UPF0291/DUF896 family)
MYKQFRRAMLAVLCASLLAGCQFVEYDQERDLAQVVAKIGSVEITKQQVIDQLEPLMSSYYGSLDPESEEYKNAEKRLKGDILKYLVEMELVKQKTHAEGTDKLTTEEHTELDQNYQSYLDYFTEQARSNLDAKKEQDASVDVEASLDEEVDRLLEENGLSREMIRDQLKQSMIYENYRDSVVADVTATPEQADRYFEERQQEQREAYDETPSAVATDFNNGELILYYAEKSVLVTQVLIKISDEDKAAIDAVKDDTELSEDEKTSRIAALREEALKKIRPTADKVYNRAKSGEDFTALIDKYNDDPGMEDEVTMSLGGYLVNEHSGYSGSFTEAALALNRAGDISKPTASDETTTEYIGYHIICVQAVHEPGSLVSLDDVRGDFKPLADDMAKTEHWDAHVESLKKELKAFVFEDRL